MLFLSHTQGCITNRTVMGEKGIEKSHATSPLDTNWQATFLYHTKLSNVAIESLIGDTLSVLNQGMIMAVSIDSITELRLVNRSRFLDRVVTGAKFGALVGATFGLLFVNPKSPFGKIEEKTFAAIFVGLEVGVLGAFVGAFVDLVSAQDQILELSQVPAVQKPYLIGPFLENHGVRLRSGH